MESPADAVPDRLGEFAILGVLGQGGTGVVYAARRGDQAVALKVLREDQVPTGRERQRFLEEAAHMARLRHPGIVQVYGAGELEDGRPYLAMEQLRGENLAQRLAVGTLNRALALDLFEQLAAAVQAMHDEGLIHRDLKPENVMLVDGGRRAVLLDFGIAKAEDAPPSTTTQAGLQRGTPAYMAPERFFGARATKSSDIYELGVILYVMLCGRLPWDNPLDAKSRLAPQGPTAHGADVPDTVEQTLMAALSSNEEERPESAARFAKAIKGAAWVTAETVLALPPTEALAPTKTMKARPPVFAYVAAATVVVGGALALTLWLAKLPGERGESALSRVDHEERGAAGPAPAPPSTTIAPDAATVVATGPADAGTVDAAHAPSAAPPPPPKSPPPDASIAAAPDAAHAVPRSRNRLPACRKLAALYCNDEFKATEGNLAGALCKQMTENVERWEAMPAEARDDVVESCTEMYPDLKAAADERLRQYRAGEGPVKPPAEP